MIKEDLSKELMKLTKEELVYYIINKTNIRFNIHDIDIKNIILDIKMDLNLKKQNEAVNKLCAHKHYEGKDKILWFENHKEWEKLNKICSDLDEEYERLEDEKKIYEGRNQ